VFFSPLLRSVIINMFIGSVMYARDCIGSRGISLTNDHS